MTPRQRHRHPTPSTAAHVTRLREAPIAPRMSQALVVAASLALALSLEAAPAEAHLSILASPPDLIAFSDLVRKCSGDCEYFASLVAEVDAEPRTITLLVGRDVLYSELESDSTGVIGQRVMGDVFLGYGTAIVDLDDLEAVPELERTNDAFAFRDPSWPAEGSSRCQLLAHVLGESLTAAREQTPDHARCHADGMDAESRVRLSYGQSGAVLDRSFGKTGPDTQTLRGVIGDNIEDIVFQISSGKCVGCVLLPDTHQGER
ncbi:MAG: hypothetical protein U0527_01115 [Candidatus Eisenbacteria bacterium]